MLRFGLPLILRKYNKSLLHSCLKCSTECQKRDRIVTRKQGTVTLIGLNRPDQRNAIDYELLTQLMEALSEAEEDCTCRAVVLHGERGNLSIGCDPHEYKIDPEIINKMSLAMNERFLKIPTVAAVTGYALGLGFELALWCDFRIVEETAVMGFPRTFGVPISERTAERLTSLLGHQKAMDWVLTGRSVKGKEAFECGVASRLVAVGSGVGQAFNLACGLSVAPHACLRADRAALYLASGKLSQEHADLLEAEKKLMDNAAFEELEKKIQTEK